MSDLPTPYVGPWKEFRRSLRAVIADRRLRLQELWRRNSEGDLAIPDVWPRDLAPLFWPLVLSLLLVVSGCAVVFILSSAASTLLRSAPAAPGPSVSLVEGTDADGAGGQPDRMGSTQMAPLSDPFRDGLPEPDRLKQIPLNPDDWSELDVEMRGMAALDSDDTVPPLDAVSSANTLPISETGPPSDAVPDAEPDRVELPTASPSGSKAVDDKKAVDDQQPVDFEQALEDEQAVEDAFRAVSEFQFADGVLLASEVDRLNNRLLLRLSLSDWKALPPTDRVSLAAHWQDAVQDMGYSGLLLVDADDRLLGRSARVGDGMILYDMAATG